MRWLMFLLIGIGGVYVLGKARPIIPYYGNECSPPPTQSFAERALNQRHAKELAEELYSQHQHIYGFMNRLNSNWYGLKANTVAVLNLAGASLENPAFTEALAARARAPVNEGFLRRYVALGLNISLCETQLLVPDSGAESASEAANKLRSLVRRL